MKRMGLVSALGVALLVLSFYSQARHSALAYRVLSTESESAVGPEKSGRTIQRFGRWTRLKAGAVEEYVEWHRKVWPEILDLTSKSGIRNYSIYIHGRELFSYFEVEDYQKAIDFLAKEPAAQRWQELMAPFMDAADPIAPWQPLEEVFHLD